MLRKPIILFTVSMFGFSGCAIASDWTMYQGNASHTGYVNTSLDLSQARLRWQKMLSANLNPVVANAKDVFATSQTAIYALATDSGNSLWTVKLNDLTYVGPPAIDANNLYFQTHGDVDAYNIKNGAIVFSTSFVNQGNSYLAPTPFNGLLFVGCGYINAVCVYDTTNGRLKWSHDLTWFDDWTPTVTKGSVFTLTDILDAFDPTTGKDIFSYGNPYTGSSIWHQDGAAVVGDMNDVIYTHADDEFNPVKNVVRSVDLTKHALVWQQEEGFKGSPVVGNAVVFVKTTNDIVQAHSEINGGPLWSWSANNQSSTDPMSNMILTKNYLLVGVGATTYAIDLSTHKTAWTYKAGGSLALEGNTLYISAADGMLSAINVGLAQQNPTIDKMTTATLHTDNYNPKGPFDIFSMAKTYYLSDGSNWDSGAGTENGGQMTLVRVDKDVDGNIHYYFKNSGENNLVFQNTDYDSGDHSAQGSLEQRSDLDVVADPNSKTATMESLVYIASNKATSYKGFNFYSANVGTIVPFKVTYTLTSGVWTISTFTKPFSYSVAGEVEFKVQQMRNILK